MKMAMHFPRPPGRAVLQAFCLCLVAFVLLLETGLQTTELFGQRTELAAIGDAQAEAFRNSEYQKSNLEKLVGGVLNLARDGDSNVMPVIDQLKKLGVIRQETKP